MMRRPVLLWILAVLITLASAYYQRVTGPTYDLCGEVTIGDNTYSYRFERSHGGDGDQPIFFLAADTTISAVLFHKRFQLAEPFTKIPMMRHGDTLIGYLPHQPPAGKLEYYLEVTHSSGTTIVPSDNAVVTRFKGGVPATVLAPHVILMFVGMLLSARTGLEVLSPTGRTRRYTFWTTVILCVGGLILGPIVQKYAFGALWTGVPFGWDLTDNKTLIACLGWIAALVAHRKNSFPRWWVVGAAVLTLIVFLIPHSTLGSQLDYSTGQIETGGEL